MDYSRPFSTSVDSLAEDIDLTSGPNHSAYQSNDICDYNSVLFMRENELVKSLPNPVEDTVKTSPKTYTVEDAVEAAGFGPFQIRVLLICGILIAADAMEMMLLSVLGPALRCDWQLSSTEVAFITTVVFIGFFFGAPFWGYISDKYGRWNCFVVVLTLIAFYGALTVLAPNYPWLLFIRALVGFAIGGGSSSFTLISEYLPQKYRAKVLLGYQVFWACGSSFEIGMAYFVLPRLGWRWLVLLSSIPIFCFLFLLKLLPESARYLIAANRKEEAQRTLEKLARCNHVSPMEGELVEPPITSEHRGNIKHLWSNGYRCTTALLPVIWFGTAFAYYGAVLVGAGVFRFHHKCFAVPLEHPEFHANGSVTAGATIDTSCCMSLSNDDFLAMVISSFGEFLIIPICILLCDIIGRKYSMALMFGVQSIFFVALHSCVSKFGTTAFLFILRALSAGAFNMAYLYTTEVYPTTIRSLALGIFSSTARIGAMITPYVAQVMLPDVSVIAALVTYAVYSFVSCVASISLPIETLGRTMPNTVDSEIYTVRYQKKASASQAESDKSS